MVQEILTVASIWFFLGFVAFVWVTLVHEKRWPIPDNRRPEFWERIECLTMVVFQGLFALLAVLIVEYEHFRNPMTTEEYVEFVNGSSRIDE